MVDSASDNPNRLVNNYVGNVQPGEGKKPFLRSQERVTKSLLDDLKRDIRESIDSLDDGYSTDSSSSSFEIDLPSRRSTRRDAAHSAEIKHLGQIASSKIQQDKAKLSIALDLGQTAVLLTLPAVSGFTVGELAVLALAEVFSATTAAVAAPVIIPLGIAGGIGITAYKLKNLRDAHKKHGHHKSIIDISKSFKRLPSEHQRRIRSTIASLEEKNRASKLVRRVTTVIQRLSPKGTRVTPVTPFTSINP